MYQAPFSICIDNVKKTIVLSVRGTLSIKDALTDMSPSMIKIGSDYHIESVKGAQCIHKVCATSRHCKTVTKYNIVLYIKAKNVYNSVLY